MSRDGWRRTVAALLCAGLLAGCEAESTPLPAFVAASPTAPLATPTRGPLRYALTADAALNADVALLEEAADVVVLDAGAPAEMDGTFELMAGYGVRAGWARSPVTPHVSLVIGATRRPLDEDDIAALVLNALDATTVVAAHGIGGSEALAPAHSSAATVLRQPSRLIGRRSGGRQPRTHQSTLHLAQ
jgi:hypothetical protein